MRRSWVAFLSLFIAGFLVVFFHGWRSLEAQNQQEGGESASLTQIFSGAGDLDEEQLLISNQEPEGSTFKAKLLSSREASYHNYAKEIVDYAPAPIDRRSSAPQQTTYEKVANLGATTRDFDNDNQRMRTHIQAHGAMIQSERNEGLKGKRRLALVVGVVPERFDAFVGDLRQVGKLVSFQVTKTDKTGDHLALMAKRAVIEKKLKTLESLRRFGGKMGDLLDLQQRIFDTVTELRALGVEIGHFEGQVSLCTVVVSLEERAGAGSPVSIASVAFRWALWVYLKVWMLLLFGAFVFLLAKRSATSAVRTFRALFASSAVPRPAIQSQPLSREFARSVVAFLLVFLLAGCVRWMVIYPQSKKSNAFVPMPPALSSPNYAKESLPGAGKGKAPQVSLYEKTGTLTTRSRDFDGDEARLRGTIKAEKVFVQQEKNEGLKGRQLLYLGLAVAPERFDRLVAGIKALGDQASFEVVKTDRTNEYQNALAKRDALRRNREDLLALQSRGAKVADLLALQEKVFSVESEIQELEIVLRRYERSTGFCTVLLTLKDVGPGPSWRALLNRAFGWTFERAVGVMVAVFFILLGLMFLTYLAGQVKREKG